MKKIDTNFHQQFDCANVVCPYCGYEPDETYPEPNGDWEEEECGFCEKKYYTTASISYDSKKSCKLNGSECEWIDDNFMNSDSKYYWFNCKNCNDTKTVKK